MAVPPRVSSFPGCGSVLLRVFVDPGSWVFVDPPCPGSLWTSATPLSWPPWGLQAPPRRPAGPGPSMWSTCSEDGLGVLAISVSRLSSVLAGPSPPAVSTACFPLVLTLWRRRGPESLCSPPSLCTVSPVAPPWLCPWLCHVGFAFLQGFLLPLRALLGLAQERGV